MTMFADDEIELLNSEVYALEQKLEEYRKEIIRLSKLAGICPYPITKQVCDDCNC